MLVAAILAQVVMMCILVNSLGSKMSQEKLNTDISDSLSMANLKPGASLNLKGEFYRFISKENQNNFVRLLKSNDAARGKSDSLKGVPGRIGILTQPGQAGDIFFNCIQSIFETIPSNSIKYELIHTSRAPPYGYGKNHGYDKFVRLVTLPMELAFVDVVSFFKNSSLAPLSEEVFTSVSRQFVRWHCRLSHASAHTPLHTVLVPDLLENPTLTYRDTINFILKGTTLNVNDISEIFLINTINQCSDKLKGIIQSESIDERIPFTAVDVENINEYFSEEFRKTNNLMAWPCLALWDIPGATSGKLKPLQNLQSLVASSMVPDCSSPYSSCFVARDLCEDKGDVCT